MSTVGWETLEQAIRLGGCRSGVGPHMEQRKTQKADGFWKGAPRMLVVSSLASFTNNDGNKTCIACLLHAQCSIFIVSPVFIYYLHFIGEKHKDKRDQEKVQGTRGSEGQPVCKSRGQFQSIDSYKSQAERWTGKKSSCVSCEDRCWNWKEK